MRRNRLFFVVLGLFMLLFAGLVYAWSVLSLPLGAYFTSWSKAQLSLTFTICMMFFCLGGMAGGMAAKRMHVRFIIWMSGLLFLIGFLASSRADTLAVLYLGVVSTTITYLLQTVSQKYVDETKSAIILSMEAVFGTIFSVIILHETITVRIILGSVMILSAVLVSEIPLKRTKQKID